MAKIEAIMKQYNEVKSKYPKALILFRTDNVYDVIGNDAVLASKVLRLRIKLVHNGEFSQIKTCNFRSSKLETYLPKLIKAGLTIAVCDPIA